MILIKIIIFSLLDNKLNIYLDRNNLPHGNFQSGNLDIQVEKIFHESTNMLIKQDYIEQLYSFSKENTIEIAYYVLLSPERAEKLRLHFLPIEKGEEKTGSELLTYAHQRLRWKVEYTNIIYSLLAKNFTLSELQKGYEIILGRTLDKRNFRKKMFSLNFLIPTDKKTGRATRPAQMYRFKERKSRIIKIFS